MSKIKRIFAILLLISLFTLPLLNLGTINVSVQRNDGDITIGIKNFLVIDGNAALNSTASAGNGSANNPYILEDYIINNTLTNIPGIIIQNTDDYFILRNCSIIGLTTTVWNTGILLNNVTNGHLTNITSNNHPGMVVGLYINASSNNNVTHCSFNSNWAGIVLYVGSHGNRLINNSVDHSTTIGIYSNASNYNQYTNNSACYCSTSGVSYAIALEYSHGNTLINNTADNNLVDIHGIFLTQSHNNTLITNTATNNSDGNGIWIQSSNNITLIGNVANNNSANGIRIDNSNNNSLIGNVANNNTNNGIEFNTNCVNNTLTSNTANHNTASGIELESSDNNTLIANEAYFNLYGIHLTSAHNNTLSGNTANENTEIGFWLYQSDNNTCTNNSAYDNQFYGIWAYQSENNKIINNTAHKNGWYGIILTDSDNNELTDNLASNHTKDGIFILSSGANRLLRNTAQFNDQAGINIMVSSDNNTLNDNLVQNNTQYGIFLDETCTYNNFTSNTIVYNDGYGVWVNGFLNLFYYNIIILNNQCQAGYQAYDNGTFNIWVDNILSCTGDADSDMLTNQQEIQLGTDLRDPDTDNDGLTDFIELYGVGSRTDPLDPDSDDDGYSDGVERAVGTDPLDPDSYPGSSLKASQDFFFMILMIALGIIVVLGIATFLFYRKAKKLKAESKISVK